MLRAVGDATSRLGLPPPAALTGDWFGALAVIAPSVAVLPVAAADAFAVQLGSQVSECGAVGGGWIGYLSYPDAGADGRGNRIPEAAGGWTDCVLRRDRDGQWWFESLSGASMPDWLAAALAATPAPDPRLPDRLGRGRPQDPSRRRTGLPGRDRRGRGLSGLRVHAVHRDGRRDPAGLLHRRRRTDVAGPGGLCRRCVGCGGVAVSGTFPAAAAARS